MSVPTPLVLILTSASLSLLNVLILPEAFPNTKLTSLFFALTSVIFFAWGVWNVFLYPAFSSPLRNLPQPKSGIIPLIGHPAITFKRPAGETFLKFMTEVPNDGLLRFPGPLNRDWLLLTDPASLGEVLVHKSYDFEKPDEIRKFLRIVLGDGLILVEGDEHKFQRRHAAPAFSFRHIRDLYPVFWSKAVDLVGRVIAEIHANPEPSDEIKPRHLEGIVEINHWANKVTMDIIGVAGIGREFNSLYSADDDLIENYEEILEPSTEKALYFAANLLFPPKLIAILPWKLNQRLKATTARLRTICRQLIRDKKESFEKQKEQPVDILSLMIKSNSFADEMLVDQLLTFLAAGHETTSSAFTWGTYLLAKHPDIQRRLRDEIRANLPCPSASLNGEVDLATILESLPLLTAVCNEVLRLYPPVPTTVRVATCDTSINTQRIPKGTRIFLSPWAINRSPLIWGDSAPDFVPERWIDADTGRANNTGGVKSNYSILTFLHGPRSCIGEKFAKSELKVLMAVFVGVFQIDMADPSEVPVAAGAITTKPKNGMTLRLQVLDDW